jgi:hypothetical protein|tara:strand:- start:22 stop:357 length:336 start_codon:yes stop_codon:yes gene_type:complete
MFNALTNLGWGVVTFAITIGVGTVVLTKFNGAVGCKTGYLYNESSGSAVCHQSTNSSNTSGLTNAGTTGNYLNTQLGTTGLSGWTPAIIAFAVGMLFLGGFLVGKGGSRQY